MKEINCPHVGWSGVCDDCTLGLEPMTCQEIETDMEYFNNDVLETQNT